MLELFETLSSYINKIQDFFAVIWEKIIDTWQTIQIAMQFIPDGIVAVFITAVVLIIILRVLGR